MENIEQLFFEAEWAPSQKLIRPKAEWAIHYFETASELKHYSLRHYPTCNNGKLANFSKVKCMRFPYTHFPNFRKNPTKSGWCRRRSDDFQTIQNVPEDFQRLANVAVRCAKSWRHLAEIAHLYFWKNNRAQISAPTPKNTRSKQARNKPQSTAVSQCSNLFFVQNKSNITCV